MNDDFEQKYDANVQEPVQIWIFCRMCRCRVQVRTLPRPTLPFRCFCGNAARLEQFDVFAREDEAVKFAKTYEDLYQETKMLLSQAEMPMPRTQTYKPGEIQKMLQMGHANPDAPPSETGGDEASNDDTVGSREQEVRYEDELRDLMAKVQRATDVMERHDALGELGRYLYARRNHFPDSRRLCYQACEADAAAAHDVIREASARWRLGKRVQLKFPLFKRYVALLTEDQKLERALEVAQRAAALGIPGYEERVMKLRQQLGR